MLSSVFLEENAFMHYVTHSETLSSHRGEGESVHIIRGHKVSFRKGTHLGRAYALEVIIQTSIAFCESLILTSNINRRTFRDKILQEGFICN